MNGAGVEERAGWGSESPCCAILGGGEKGDWEDAAEGRGREGREWYSGTGGEAVSVFNFV